ncbi:hypothetical protein Tco_0845836 [Tanacetum coccineum]
MESSRRSILVEITTSNALVSCDGLGGYDWSDQAEKYPLNIHSWLTHLQVLILRISMPPKPDLSFTGLEEFTNEPVVIKPVVENSKAKVKQSLKQLGRIMVLQLLRI